MSSGCNLDTSSTLRRQMPTRAEWIDHLQRLAEAERQVNPSPSLQESPAPDENAPSDRAAAPE
ncbi:hypothetical protein APY03_4448 [Variovorax sp. WDL1]|nr:hypothetical protein APY03_4448 [Variovorax sp. WDL1]